MIHLWVYNRTIPPKIIFPTSPLSSYICFYVYGDIQVLRKHSRAADSSSAYCV